MDENEWLKKSLIAVLNSGKSTPEKFMLIMELIESYEAMKEL
jgi:hypothetical protein